MTELLESPTVQGLLLLGIFVIGIVFIMMLVYTPTASSIQLFNGALQGNHTTQYHQNPDVKGSKLLPRSQNRAGGAEFTYSWWMMVNQFGAASKPQHVFMKGYPKPLNHGTPNTFCPSVVVYTKSSGENVLQARFNTFTNETEVIEVENIPISKWIHCSLTVERGMGKLYMNGRLAKTITFAGVLNQNYGPLVVAPQGGFSGLISDLMYHSYALNPVQIADAAAIPPNKSLIAQPGADDSLPYMSKGWYLGK
jgi:hypothetical protein